VQAELPKSNISMTLRLDCIDESLLACKKPRF
jgi:hypothetical protein